MEKKVPVFIVHSSDDICIVKRHFIYVLERDCNATCIYDVKDFKAGKTTIANIGEAIKKCHKTFVIVTPSSVEKNWVKYEMLLALEKSQRSRRLGVTLFLFNMERDVVKGQLFGVLSDAMMVTVNLNKEGWEDRLKQSMLDKLKEDPPMGNINIAANLSVGQAWSHFTGYGKIVLPLLKDRIQSSRWYKENSGRFPVVEFNLIPDTAITAMNLNHLDDRITYEGSLDEIIACRGSFGDRHYTPSVYSICDKDGEKYYCVAQIPNTLSILGKLEHSKEPTGLQLSRGERSLQVARFSLMYNRLVNHPHAKDCNNMVVLLEYNVSKCRVGDVLMKAIKKAIKKSLDSSQQVPVNDVQCCQELECCRDEDPCESEYSKTVFINFIHEDTTTAMELQQVLEKNDFKVITESFGKSHFQNLEEAMKKCKWAIFVISKKSIDHEEFPLLHFKFRMLISQCVEENEVRVIPVADDIREDQISADLRAVTYLSKQEPHYTKKLLQILTCDSIPMECPVSAQDVHQGLAYAYVLNYLNVTLPDRTKHFDIVQQNNPHCTVYRKMFIIIPSSCASKSLGALDKDEHGRLINPDFEQLQDIHYKAEDVGGVVNRKYQLVTYKITTPNKSYIVAVEYPNAILCLQEMSHLNLLSGLSKDALYNEAWGFKELVQSIMDMQKHKPKPLADMARLLYFDDSKWTVGQAILEELQKEETC